MKNTRKYKLLSILLAMVALLNIATVSHAAVTDPGLAGARWTASFSDPYFMGTSMTSTPVISDQTIYVVNRDTLYALSTDSGAALFQVELPARMNSVCDPILDGKRLYIPLAGGAIVCVDIEKKTVEWKSDSISDATAYQTLGRLYYYKGHLYAGVWANAGRASADTVNSKGVFFCVNAENGKTMWCYENKEKPCGFYWNRAVACHNRLYFTSEDGTLISHGLTDDTVFETKSLSDGEEIRNGLIASDDGRYLYTVMKKGTLVRVTLATEGAVKTVDKTSLISDTSTKHSIQCTSTPTIWGNRLYAGCYCDGYGTLCVIDTDTFRPIYAAKGPKSGEVKSTPCVIIDKNDPNAAYIYVTANEKTGALYVLKDHKNAVSGDLVTLFTPYSAKQFCLANVVAGEDETLYYSNDSGTLFAVENTLISADLPKDIKKKKKKMLKAIAPSIYELLIKLFLP